MGVKKFFVYKKYSDEIWGKLLFKNFSYVKNSVFENYKKRLVRRFFLRSYYRYFRSGFIDKLNIRKFFSLSTNFSTKRFFFQNLLNKKKKPFFSRSVKPLHLGISVINIRLVNNKVAHINLNNTILTKVPVMKSKVFIRLNEIFLRANAVRFYFIKKAKMTKNKGFFYSTHIATPAKRKKKRSLFFQKHAYYKKISTYFGFKKISDFVKFYSSFNFKYETGLYTILFCKLDTFLNCLNLFPSIYFIQKFIQGYNVFINNIPVSSANYIVALNQIVTFNKKYFKRLYFNLLKKLYGKKIFLNVPPYIELDYKLLSLIMFKFPEIKFINQPFSFNLYTKFFNPVR
jgi:hypothetical protein